LLLSKLLSDAYVARKLIKLTLEGSETYGIKPWKVRKPDEGKPWKVRKPMKANPRQGEYAEAFAAE
jgi:hypothetical protein